MRHHRTCRVIGMALILALSGPAQAKKGGNDKGNGPTPKVDICHRTNGQKPFIVISTSSNALPAHLAHGDHLVGQFWVDADGDGFGAAGSAVSTCQLSGYVANDSDCNDTNAAINPNAADAICDDVDDNCSGAADEQYAPLPTTCGLGVCNTTGATYCQSGQVLDSCAPLPKAEALDFTCDNLDGDCDGATDEDYIPLPTSCGLGVCLAAGVTSCVAGGINDSCTEGPKAEAQDITCDGLDGDCDGAVDEDFDTSALTCGQGVCSNSVTPACVNGTPQNMTCTEGPKAEAADLTCDGLDGDCDGSKDEDYQPRTLTCGDGLCANAITTSCAGGVESGTCVPDWTKKTTEVCNGVDDDCNGASDDGVAPVPYYDYPTDPATENVGICQAGIKTCQAGGWVVTTPQVTPGTETCGDTTDEDCDNALDNGCGSTAQAVSSGYQHTCILDSTGKAYCAGLNNYGQLGHKAVGGLALYPVPVDGGLTFSSIVPSNLNTCAIATDGKAYCWGWGGFGELGTGVRIMRMDTPQLVVGNHTWKQLGARGFGFCGITTSGDMYCWGNADGGQTGTGPNTPSYVLSPMLVAGGHKWASLSTTPNSAHMCGITTAGIAMCWGSNSHGQLGVDASSVNKVKGSNVPIAVNTTETFTSISHGFYTTCGVTTAGKAMCWGYGAVGDGNWPRAQDTPVAVNSNLTFVSISSGYVFNCGLTTTGEAYCWGDNAYGQLGDGTQTMRLSPVAVQTTKRFTALSLGHYHSCGLTTDSTVMCWGYNSKAQHGTGGFTWAFTPVEAMLPTP